MQNMEDFYQQEPDDWRREEINEEQENYVCENPPFNNFDEQYLDLPDIDEQMWTDWQNRLHEAKQEIDNKDLLDVEDYIDTWERQDDKRHEEKGD